MRKKKSRATPNSVEGCCSSTTTPYLSDDLILEILSRVPKEHLFKLNSVSKTWNSLISNYVSPTYGLIYSAHDVEEKQIAQLRYACLSRGMKPCIGGDCCRVMERCFGSLPAHLDLWPVSSCRGFLLFANRESETEAYHVLNPYTKQCKEVPKPRHFIRIPDVSALVINPPHYKVVHLLCPHDPLRKWKKRIEMDVFSSETGEWATYKPRCHQQVECICNATMVAVDGTLYWVYYEQYLHRYRVGESMIRGIRLPDTPLFRGSCIGECRGRLYCAMETCGFFKVWMLKDFDAAVWVLKCSVESGILGMGSLDTNERLDDQLVVTLWGFHPDLEVVFLKIGGKIVAYHFVIQVLEEVCVVEGNWYVSSVFPYSSCKVSLEDVCQKEGQQKYKCE